MDHEIEEKLPAKMTLSEIAIEQCPALQACLLIFYSKKTSDWEKRFAKSAYSRQLWRLENPCVVPPSMMHPSVKEEALLRKITAQRGLDNINLMDFSPLEPGQV